MAHQKSFFFLPVVKCAVQSTARNAINVFAALFVAIGMLLASNTVSAVSGVTVLVEDPFIELHTGPGIGYPIFHIVERHESVSIIYRKMDWFKVETKTGQIGWVIIDQMERTFAAPGVKAKFPNMNFDDFSNRRYEMGAMVGDFEGANLMSIYGSYHFQSNLSFEASYSQATGKLTNSSIVSFNMVSTPFPKWSYAPFFSIGLGVLDVDPRKSTTGASTSDSLANVGIGLRYYMTRRFMIRVELKQYITFVDDNDLGEFTEWKGGFSFFF